MQAAPPELYLMRHCKPMGGGEALHPPSTVPVKNLIRLMVERDEKIPDIIVYSPLARTKLTAELAAKVIEEVTGRKIPLVEAEGLKETEHSVFPLKRRLNVIAGFSDEFRIVLAVTHEPIIRDLIENLTGQEKDAMMKLDLKINAGSIHSIQGENGESWEHFSKSHSLKLSSKAFVPQYT
jgi:broad specificity phosphatase PhoE